jgi:hypothetical protein
MDLVIYIFRNSNKEGTSSALSTAKEHLRCIFARSPSDARRLAVHAASIVAIARECIIYTPCETIRVFMGFAFLLAFNKFFPFQIYNENNDPSFQVMLDELP